MENRDCYPRPIFRDNQCRLDVSTASNKVFLNLNLTSAKQTLRFNKPIANVLEVQVQSVEVPISWNNINETNYYFVIRDAVAANPFLIQVDAGNWPATDLAAELTSKMTTAITGYGFDIVVTYSKVTNKFNFVSNPVAQDFEVDFDFNNAGYPAGATSSLGGNYGYSLQDYRGL